jgi:hypothetical protein
MRSFRIEAPGALATAAVLCCCTGALAYVYGLKTHDPLSGPPTHLYRIAERIGSFTDLGELLVDGASIDADALARSPLHGMFAFEITTTGSQMILIDVVTVTGTRVGSPLDGRDIRGAAFDLDGRLLVIDATGDELLEIDPATADIIGDPVALTIDAGAFDVTTVTDVAVRIDGQAYLSSASALHTLDTATGELTEVAHFASQGLAGLAFSNGSPSDDELYVYEVNGSDDIFLIEIDNGYDMTLRHQGIIPSYNAGRGDLAGFVTPSPDCPPDINADGSVNSQDFVVFLNHFVAGNLGADFNRDEIINSQDFTAFFNAFVSGC